jgi:iron complex outermembrane receptor protein
VFLRLILLAVLSLAVSLPASGQIAPAAETTQPRTREPEIHPDQEVVVVSASRREEELINAPATMSVITAEMIANAPSPELVDLMRDVPGMNVSQTSARDVNMTTRAATGTLSDSTLVLLDGRSIYQDFFGFVLWDFVPVDSTEFKQIEIIRGPASAVWGANAMTGVINIRTKTPREMAGNHLDIRFGQFDRSLKGQPFDGGGLFAVHVIHARSVNDRLAYKVSGTLFTQQPFPRPAGTMPGTGTPYPQFENQGTTQPKLDVRVDYDTEDGREALILSGGISGTDGIIHSGLGPFSIPSGSTLKYGKLSYQRNKLRVQFFVNAVDGQTRALLLLGGDGQPLSFNYENQAYDAEVSNLHVLGSRHLVSYGGNYRHNDFNLSLAPLANSRDEGGAYVQDQIFLSDRFRWVLGTRFDRFGVLDKLVFSPRTTFMVKPAPKQTIRFSYNRAFRSPSFIDNFLSASLLNDVDLGAAGRFRFPVRADGNPTLREEELSAYETGYTGEFSGITLGGALYLNRSRNTIQFTQVASYTSANPPPQWPLPPAILDALSATGRGLPSKFTYLNFDRIRDRGLELSLDARVAPGATVFTNYSWQAEPSAGGFDLSELNLPPTHRLNAGTSIVHGRYTGSASVNVVSEAFWQDVLDARLHGPTSAYTLINAGFAVKSPDGSMSVAVRGTNLFNQRVQQHVFGDVINRTVTGEVHFGF